MSDRHRLLDIGCGPGGLIYCVRRAFVGIGRCAWIQNQNACAARDAARQKPIANGVDRRELYDLGPHLGIFRQLTIGRALSRLDRGDTTEGDALIEPDGAASIQRRRRTSENAWYKPISAWVVEKAMQDRG